MRFSDRALALLFTLCAAPVWAHPALPVPTGPWALGTTTFDWVDEQRGEPATAATDDLRLAVVQIWYPTEAQSGKPAAYMPRLDAYRQTTDEATIEQLRGVETNAWQDAPIAEEVFPVVVFSHGWSGSRSWYSLVLEHVASHGYAVVGIDHPYLGEVAMPDGSITTPDDSYFASSSEAFEHYGSDVIFVLDQLEKLGGPWAGRLDLERVVTAGHSSGGATAGEAAARDPRIKAFVSFDSGVRKTAAENGIQKPVMLFRAAAGSYTGVIDRNPRTHPKGTIYPASFFADRRDPFYEVIIANTTHGSFGDWGVLFGETAADRHTELGKRRRVVEYLVAFLDQHLKEEPRAPLHAHTSDTVQLIMHPAPTGGR